ncbi:transporter, partial [candidate division CSSED10-310 bacterium]
SSFSSDYLDSGMMGQASFRYSLFHKVELEAIVPYYRVEPKVGDSLSGMGKISLGVTYSKIKTRYVQFGFFGGILIPNSDSDLAYLESGANGLDFKFKGLISFPLGEMTSIQGNVGYILTGEGDTPAQKDVDPEDIILYDVAFNHFIFDKKLKLIVELNGMKQDEASRLAVAPAIRWEIVPAFIFEGYASISVGDEDYRLYDTLFGIGFTYEFFSNR